ncbi:EF-hand and coiled-coil domain-containing protein 1 [Megalops cyprinoides]|uniref:EF-hand and coiled-coil domain-containing protein 1 n=1 Tax=Megalops cyprinoides TaxID=118141 RepID=UPI001864FA71|nr:EF-hand and coiled-coil domain-containing protein 1 [Megalops cyprinoides]
MDSSRISKTNGPQTLIRASRKSEWLRSALAHYYNPDPGVENEIVVLATGIDQYLQEVFHHLAYYNGDDLVSEEDFRLLCSVLGISSPGEGGPGKADGEEARDVCAGLPRELRFKEFHRRLCGYFSVRAPHQTTVARLPVAEETEHVEREIRLRWPRVRRRKCVSFDLSGDIYSGKRPMRRAGSLVNAKNRFEEKDDETDSSPQGAALQQLETENASLRELVEDLRSALQGSDARCLVLEVALRRQSGVPTRRSAAERRGEAGAARPPKAEWGTRGTRGLQRELEIIRASRDGQLEEAMRFNQRLEEELRVAFEEGRRLEEAVTWLQRENGQIKRKAEEARTALARGLDRVKEIQGLAHLVPTLQNRVQDLETELQGLRNQRTCRTEQENQEVPPAMAFEPLLRHLPTDDESCIRGEEGLQRAVEGRAASDEEEEERGGEEVQCCLLELKRLINRLHSCSKGCQSTAARHLLAPRACCCESVPSGISVSVETRGRGHRGYGHLEESGLEKMVCSLEKDLQLKQEEVEMLRLEIQMVETERVRLSLLEEKLTDALTLLLQLRTKNISRRALGKILMDMLDVCCKNGHGPSHGLQVLDTLCSQLLSCELLGEEGGSRTSAGPHRNSANPLLISC